LAPLWPCAVFIITTAAPSPSAWTSHAIVASDVAALLALTTEDYTFVNPQGALVTRAGRAANLASGNTNLDAIDDEREITVRMLGDAAVVHNLATLRGRYNGVPINTDLRGTFVWVRRNGSWRLLTNQVTEVATPSN
jgi:ketosteroid isomerase-like protein